MASVFHRICQFHPILERRYSEQTHLYLFKDADEATLSHASKGIFYADLRKTAVYALAGGLLLCLLLKHK